MSLRIAYSHLRLIYSCITQLKAQGPSRTCNESKEKEEALPTVGSYALSIIHYGLFTKRLCSQLFIHEVYSRSAFVVSCRAERVQLNGVKNFYFERGSSQGPNLAVTVLFVPFSVRCGVSAF